MSTPTCPQDLCTTPDDVPLTARIAHTPTLCIAHTMEQQGDEALREGLPRTARIAYGLAAMHLHAHTRA